MAWLLVFGAGMAMSVSGVSPHALAAETRADSGAEFLGFLPSSPKDQHHDFESGIILTTNFQRRRLYYTYFSRYEGTQRFVTYELNGAVPRFLSDIPFARDAFPGQIYPGQNLVSLDAGRNRFFIANGFADGRPRITVLDLNTGVVKSRWENIALSFPGFNLQGLTYSPEDDRVYAVGETIANENLGNWSGWRPPVVTAVIAFNAADGSVAWRMPVPACQQPMSSYHGNALIARSTRSPALYVPCVQTVLAPRTSGIAKINLGKDGGAATQQDTLGFTTEYFPISGRYQGLIINGVRSSPRFDPATDRIYLLSLSEAAPGTWVFDGRLSAWVGFIYLPSSSMDSLSVNPANGHVYVGSGAGPLLVTSGRGTPVSQGNAYPIASSLPVVGDVGVIFTHETLRNLGLAPKDSDATRWVVRRDGGLDEPTLVEPDYDERTYDIPETAQTDVAFAGGITGYGSRVLWVGGWGGLVRSNPIAGASSPTEILRNASTGAIGQFSVNDVGLHSYDRGLMMARIINLDVRDGGSSATAQSVSVDAGTSDEWNARRQTLAESCHRSTTRVLGVPGDASCTEALAGASMDSALQAGASSIPEWPWRSSTCLDAGGEGQNPSPQEGAAQGYTEVSCSSKNNETKATSEFGSFKFTGGVQQMVVHFDSSSFSARTYRDQTLGTVSEAVATAKGISIATELAKISIAEVDQSVRVSARGRPGTTQVTATRRLKGIVIERQGNAAQVIADCMNESCEETVNRLNRTLGEAVRIDMPQGERTATPRGAFAGYQKTRGQYIDELMTENDDTRSAPALKITLYGDSDQKTRVVFDFAAVEATASYYISPAQDVESPGIDLGGHSSETFPTDREFSNEIGNGHDGNSSIAQSGGGQSVARGLTALLTRSPAEAAQLGSTLLLLGLAVASIVRRTRSALILERSSGG